MEKYLRNCSSSHYSVKNIAESSFSYYIAENRHVYKWQALSDGARVTRIVRASSLKRSINAFFQESPSLRRPRSSSHYLRHRLSDLLGSRRSSLRQGELVSSMKQLQTYDKELIAKRLNQVYELIKMHPDDLVERLVIVYHQMQLLDVTLQNRHMELAIEIQKKNEEILKLSSEWRYLRKKFEQITDCEEGFAIQAVDEQDKEQYFETSVAQLAQGLSSAVENNSDFRDKAGNFVFYSYLFLLETLQR